MASFFSISTMMMIGFLVFEGMITFPALASADIKPEAAYGPDLKPAYAPEPSYAEEVVPPEPRPGYFQYLHTCASHIHQPFCALEILQALDGKGPVDKNCCKQLVEMGRDCHLALVEAIKWVHVKETAPYYAKYQHFIQGLSKAAPVLWDQCVKTVATRPLPIHV